MSDHEQARPLGDVHVCLECGTIWDRPCNCPVNEADSPTRSVTAYICQLAVARDRAREAASLEATSGQIHYENATRYRDALQQVRRDHRG